MASSPLDALASAPNRIARARTALLTNFVPPYRIPVFLELRRLLGEFRILISTPMEPNRPWPVEFAGLDVQIQRSITRSRVWKHPSGFEEKVYTHFPWDTVPALLRFRPDAVISSEFGYRSLNAIVFRLLRRRSRLLIWATLSESSERERGKVRETLRRTILRFVDGVLVNGRSGVRYLTAFGFPRERIFIVPQTIDVAAFSAVPLERSGRDAERLLFVGQVVERKGLAPFLRVLARWCADHPQRAVELRVAGDGPARSSLEAIDTPPNLRIEYLGSVPYADLPKIYASAGALVFPTLADEWGLVVNEALASGLPVLGSVYGQAVEDLIVEGENGWTFRIDDPEQVYGQIGAFFATPADRLSHMRAAARATALALPPSEIAGRIANAIAAVRGPQ